MGSSAFNPRCPRQLAQEGLFFVGSNTLLYKAAGIEFIDENGGGPGVRLRKPHKKRT
jgi:hypothetical protein